jgi:hypothetical protein
MPDNLEQLRTRLARDLTTVSWPEPGQIRAQARRRTMRTVVAAPLAVVLVVAAVAWALRAGSASPSSYGPAAGPPHRPAATAATPSVDDGTSIPIEALLQPDDVGPARHIENENTWSAGAYPAWTFSKDQCPAYAGLKLTAYQDYQFMRIHQVVPDRREDFNLLTVFVEAHRYPGDTAATVMGDVRRIVAACPRFDSGPSEASTPERPAHGVHALTVLDEGFAGTESLLIHDRSTSVDDRTGDTIGEPIVMIYAVVRVNDLVTTIGRYTEDRAAVQDLGPRAAARLCPAANPPC